MKFTMEDVEVMDERAVTCLAPDCSRRYYVVLSEARDALHYCSQECQDGHTEEIMAEMTYQTRTTPPPVVGQAECGCPVHNMSGFRVTSHRLECPELPSQHCRGCDHDYFPGEEDDHMECGQA